MNAKNKTFYPEITYLRAIACIMVVIVHVTVINVNFETGFFSDLFSMYIDQFSRLGTPIFAVISAFLLFGYIERKDFDCKRFYQSRFVKVVSPYIIWSIFYLLLRAFLSDDPTLEIEKVKFTFQRTIGNIFFGRTFFHLYFISTVVQFYLVFPLLLLIPNRKYFIYIFLLTLPVNYLFLINIFSDFFEQFGNIGKAFNNRALLFNWISFFMFGGVLRLYYKEIKKSFLFIPKNAVFLLLLVCICVLSGIQNGAGFNSSRPENLIYVPLFSLAVTAIFCALISRGVNSKILKLIGDYSMGIYVLHPALIIFLNKIIPFASRGPIYVVIMVVMTLAVAVTLIHGILKLPYSNFIVPVASKNISFPLK